MDNNLLYWIFEYIKVLFSYGFVLFIWPMIVFRKYLRSKNATFRFCFCATTQVIIINTLVLMLGLFHILNKWTMCIAFYGILIWSLRDKLKLTEERKKRLKSLITGTLGWKQFFLICWDSLYKELKNTWKIFAKFYKKHWIEYTTLILVLAYGMLYFSYGAFLDYSYGFGDMYVHHSWIYGLIEGKIFSAGVYPEAMHCVIYSMHALLGVEVYSCMLFLAGIHVAVILLAAYCLMKEVFQWRFSAVFVLILYLILDLACIDEVFSMSRLQWTLPQEYGFHTMYIIALSLILYLKSYKKTVFRDVEYKACWDENLFLFMMALAASIAIHFYVTIMAFFICFAIVLFKLGSVFHRKHFIPLVVAAITGLLIAFIPMGGALASGIPFQGSIGWAMNVINGTDKGVGRAQNTDEKKETTQTQDVSVEEVPSENGASSAENNNSDTEISNGTIVNGVTENLNNITVEVSEPGLFEKIKQKAISLGTLITEKMKGIYANGYVTLYRPVRAKWIVGFTYLAALLYVIYRIGYWVKRKILKRPVGSDNLFPNYLPIIFASFLFMLLYAAPLIGLPELIAGARLCTTEQMLILMVIIMPFDMLFSLFMPSQREDTLALWSVVVSVGFIVFVCVTGSYHGYLYYELTRYNAAVTVTNEIRESLPQNTYTIVSTTDEIYQVIQDGRHEELLTFLNSQVKTSYTLPTEYVFIFVEKRPIQYAHSHFFSGPDWLALEKYQDMYTYSYSVCPDIACSQISADAAQQSIRYFKSPSHTYANLDSRTIVESKAYEWCQRFEELYPHEFKVYYEDDDFVCYYIQQNPQRLYNLVIE